MRLITRHGTTTTAWGKASKPPATEWAGIQKMVIQRCAESLIIKNHNNLVRMEDDCDANKQQDVQPMPVDLLK